MLYDGLFISTAYLLIAGDTCHAVGCTQDVSKVFVLRVEDLVEDLGFDAAIVGFLCRINLLRPGSTRLVICDDLVIVEFILSVLWSSVLHRLLKLLLLLFADSGLVLVINVLLCEHLFLAGLT